MAAPTEDRPSVDERYAKAINSAALQVLPQQCDIDFAISAGFVRDGLGMNLLRLRIEWDGVRSEQRQAESTARAARGHAQQLKQLSLRQLNAATDSADKGQCERLMATSIATRSNAQALLASSNAAYATAHTLVVIKLKSLRQTTSQLNGFTLGLARCRKFSESKRQALAISGRALDLWLDPVCHSCEGVGHTIASSVRVWCPHCDATGQRDKGPQGFKLARSDAGEQFGRALLVEMDRKAAYVTRMMQAFMSSKRDALNPATGPAMALKARLEELRSTQAMAD